MPSRHGTISTGPRPRQDRPMRDVGGLSVSERDDPPRGPGCPSTSHVLDSRRRLLFGFVDKLFAYVKPWTYNVAASMYWLLNIPHQIIFMYTFKTFTQSVKLIFIFLWKLCSTQRYQSCVVIISSFLYFARIFGIMLTFITDFGKK